jgi:hypothetical protein
MLNATSIPKKSKAEIARENGARSKGPKTEEGKARSSQNALKHGLTAKKWVGLPSDAEDKFEVFREGILQDLRPQGPIQLHLAETVVQCMWRQRRILSMEARLEQGFEDSEEDFANMSWLKGYTAIARYEAHIDRTMHRAMKTLQELKESQPQDPMAKLREMERLLDSLEQKEHNEPTGKIERNEPSKPPRLAPHVSKMSRQQRRKLQRTLPSASKSLLTV